MKKTAKEIMQEMINAVEKKGGYINDHDIDKSRIFNHGNPVVTVTSKKHFAGCCILGGCTEEVGFLMNAPIFCINEFYLSEKGWPHLSRRSIGGLINEHDISNKEDLERFNKGMSESYKITHVLLKDGTYIEM